MPVPLGHLIMYGRGGGLPDPFNTMRLMDESLKVSGFVLPVVYGTRRARAWRRRSR